MRIKTWQEALSIGQRLQRMWVGDGPVDLKRIQASIRQDIEFTRQNPARMTPACLTECRNDRALVGQLLNQYSDLFLPAKEPV